MHNIIVLINHDTVLDKPETENNIFSNIVRGVYIPRVFAHLDEFLELLGGYGITLMPVLFGDCCVPKDKYKEPCLGPQPEPVPGYFGGSPVTPFDDSTQSGETIGYSITDEPENRPIIEEYMKELASRYGQDPRILIWNVWNEAGNSGRLNKSLPIMEAIFSWLREMDVMQPLTADVWGQGLALMNG